MRKISLLSSIAFLTFTAAAQAGIAQVAPGPELGEGYVGLAVLAAIVGGYVLVRQLRVRSA
jgi:hypothetical protein